MNPEQEARERIDAMLEQAGWTVQDYKAYDPRASDGMALREFPLKTGFADYLLIVKRKAVGVIEAKKVGTPLAGVDSQSEKYLHGMPDEIPHLSPLPFAYESTGVKTLFRDVRDPNARSREVFSFHRPDTLYEWLTKEDTLRERLRTLPPLMTDGLRQCQVEAITNLEQSFYENRPRALVQMATGTGKTYTAVTSIYRLIKHADAKRVLFLVDRNNLGKQTKKEFEQYITPDDGRKFTELYNIQHMTSNVLDPVARVNICTIQRLYSMLLGEQEYDAGLDERSIFEYSSDEDREQEVAYNQQIPPEYFDFIVTDECHRSIYKLWRQVLDYFDAFIVGLTATPSKQTFGFFNKNLVMEYGHERAVVDGVNVGYDIYKIETKITKEGSNVDAGFYVDKRDRLTRKKRIELLDEQLEYQAKDLDRAVVAPDQIRTIIRTFRDRIPEIFPYRKEVPKTLVFAKDDSHADDITHVIREEFGKGNEFCKKITYRADNPSELIKEFRNSYNPRIAVTVDMVSTGTDIKPLECLLFMRSVNSAVLYEQMKGRGTRTISPDDLRAVTPDAAYKDRFVIVDTVGVTESALAEPGPIERNRTISFENLLKYIVFGNRDEDHISSLAGRLSRLDKKLEREDLEAIRKETGGFSLREIAGRLFEAIDPDVQIERAKASYQTETPTDEQLDETKKALLDDACEPLMSAPLRELVLDAKRRSEQTIDTVSVDVLLHAGYTDEKAKGIVTTFQQFIEDNKDEIDALSIIYNKRYGERHLTYEDIKALADSIKRPPYNLTPDALWAAYQKLEASRVRGARPHKLLTDIISLVRFAIGEVDVLSPYEETVRERFDSWLSTQESNSIVFSTEQRQWLEMIRDHIATSLTIEIEDFELTPFLEKGGAMRAYQVLGKDFNEILEELNEVLTS